MSLSSRLHLRPSYNLQPSSFNKLPKDDVLPFEEVYNPEFPGGSLLQYGQYKGKTFEWIVVNDPSYISYLSCDYLHKDFDSLTLDREKVFHALCSWAMTFKSCKDAYAMHKDPRSLDECHNKIIAFGPHKGMTYTSLYDSNEEEHKKYIANLFNTPAYAKRSTFAQFQDYVRERKSFDESQNLPVIPDNDFIDTAELDDSLSTSQPSKKEPKPKSKPSSSVPFFRKSHGCSEAQKLWMAEELKRLGLFPGIPGFNTAEKRKGQALFRFPPPPELQVVNPGHLPSAYPFYIHPIFLWFPILFLKHLMEQRIFPCASSGCKGQVSVSGLGNACVVVGSGTYATGLPNCAQLASR